MNPIELCKSIESLAAASGQFELHRQAVELKSAIYDLLEDLRQARSQIDEANRQADSVSDLKYEENAFWEKASDGKRIHPAYCPKCLQSESKRVRMLEQYSFTSPMCICPICQTSVRDPDKPEHTLRAPQVF